MSKLIFLILFLIPSYYCMSGSVILKSEKSYDSGRTFIVENLRETKELQTQIKVPKSQILYDKNKDIYLTSNDGGRTWYNKELKVINSLTIFSDMQLNELLPNDTDYLKITDINGSIVEAELTKLKNGIYFIQLIQNNKFYYYKVMVLK